jgi:glycosyltransferase involved in cell wall biosynthesis
MRILMISWEYPPYVVGGLGKHAAELLPPLGGLPGIELDLLTTRLGGGHPVEKMGRTTVHRVELQLADGAFYPAVMRANKDLEEYAHHLWDRSGPFDLVHVHDWLAAPAGMALKRRYKVPLLSTIHATERGRGRGRLAGKQARSIHDVEWSLTFESWRVIACSDYMADEVYDYFQCPRDKVDIIPNGVETERFDRLKGKDLRDFRRAYASPSESIVFSVGRVVAEKGLHVLLRALPLVLAESPAARVVIAGKGPELETLRSLARSLDVGDKTELTGFIADRDRDRLFKVADCAVFPSLYEPFGIVALEAMAAECPVVVSEVGGLRDVVRHGETGLKVQPDDPESLAWAIVDTLQHRKLAAKRVANAYRAVREEYNWDRIAQLTADVYRTVIAERAITEW